MFEQASRLKLRFPTPQGHLSVEQVWDLPLTSANPSRANLDDLAKDINRELKASSEESFVTEATQANTELQLMLDLVKHVIAVRIAENKAKLTAKENQEKKQRILELIAHKQDEVLSGKSLEELNEMVASL